MVKIVACACGHPESTHYHGSCGFMCCDCGPVRGGGTHSGSLVSPTNYTFELNGCHYRVYNHEIVDGQCIKCQEKDPYYLITSACYIMQEYL